MKPCMIQSQIWCCDNANWLGPVPALYMPTPDERTILVMQLIVPYSFRDWDMLHDAVSAFAEDRLWPNLSAPKPTNDAAC